MTDEIATAPPRRGLAMTIIFIIRKYSVSHFLQSKDWEQFQKTLQRKTWRLDDGTLILERALPLGQKSLYAAGANYNPQMLVEAKKIAQETKAMFFKFEPMIEDVARAELLGKAGFLKSVRPIQPQKTIVVDLKRTEAELLAAMHPKTRYNIRVAQKNSVQIRQSENTNADYEIFWELLQKTAERDKFFTHGKEYYRVLLASFGKACPERVEGEGNRSACKLFFAEKNGQAPSTRFARSGQALAGAIALFFESQAYYLHGASDHERRNLMAPYLLHWEIMREAQKQNYESYDFWGVDEKKWPGVTRFKRGFGGRAVEYMGSYDYIFNKIPYFFYALRARVK